MMQRMKGTLRPGRKAGVLALAVLLLTCVLMAGAVSADGTWDGTTITSVSPSGNTYSISSGSELAWVANEVNSGNNTFQGMTLELTQDIDLDNHEWTPIGSAGKAFAGTFDGKNYTISNLTITKDLENADSNNYVGLFGYTVSPSVIKNIKIQNVNVSGDLYVGGVVGMAYTGKEIRNCHISGDIHIKGSWYVGGIGGNGYMGVIADCSVGGESELSEIRGIEGHIGGIWGFRGEGDQKIINCTVKNIAISGADRTGGISGILHYGNAIEKCTVTAVTVSISSDADTVGGIAGTYLTEPGYTQTISGCTFKGEVYKQDVLIPEGDRILGGAWNDDPYLRTDVIIRENTFNEVFVDDRPAKIDNVYYDTLEAAFDSVQSGETIELLRDTNGNGIIVQENSKFTVDLNGFTYTIDGTTVGSTGTETNGFQLLKGSEITFKNGTITSTKAKILIQNYANLTLEDVELVGGPTVQYVLSNNFGNTQLRGDTSITASGDNVAFDVYYWPDGGYGDGVSVTIEDRTVKIQGKVVYAHDGTATDDEFSEKASLIIPPGYTLEAPSGYHWASSGTGWKLVADDPADIADTLVLTVNPQTVTAGNTVTLTATLTNSTSGTEFYGVPVTINGVSGVTGLTGAPITYTANTVGTFTLTAETTDPALTSTSVTLTVNSRPVPPTPVTSSSGNMDNAYRVLFNDGATTLSVQTDLSSGDKLTKPETPVKDGYTFAGWYKDSACTQPWDFETGIPGDMTLYAKWTAAGSSGETEATATPTKTQTAVTTPQPTKTQTAAATTSAPEATTAAGVSPTLTQAPAPVAGALFGLLAAGVLLRRRFQ